MPILCHHSRVNHSARGFYHVLRNQHVMSYDRSGASSQTPGHGPMHSPSIPLYLAAAFHKAAGNTPSLISANGRSSTGKTHKGNKRPIKLNKPGSSPNTISATSSRSTPDIQKGPPGYCQRKRRRPTSTIGRAFAPCSPSASSCGGAWQCAVLRCLLRPLAASAADPSHLTTICNPQ